MSAANIQTSALDPRRRLTGASSRARPVFAVVAVMFAVVATALPGAVPVFAAPCWQPPVAATVADPFRRPDCPWCPGNRGVEYATTAGDPVTSVAAGTVSFTGSIVGIRYVVVEMANQWRLTYGNLSDLSHSEIRVGETVVAGMAIGAAGGPFHFGLRDGDTYIDPAPYLGEWQFRARLVPTDGARPAPAPPPTLRCGTGGSGGSARTLPERDSSLRR